MTKRDPNAIAEPKVLSGPEDTFARRIMQNISDKHVPDPSSHTYMMLEHFNSHPSGRATFSHFSLGTKLRRYGK